MAWEEKTLSQISENLDNRRVPITKKIRSNGSIPYYGASGIVDYVEEYIFDEDLLLVSEDGANLLARTYPIAFSINGKTWVNNHAHVLRFKDKISQRFVEFYLNSIKLDDFVSGMAQPKLNQTMLNKIPIPFPPISEQKCIVAILDEAFESITKAKENAEKNLNNSKEIFKSYLQSVFENKGDGWEEKTLGEVCETGAGGTPLKSHKEYYEGGTIPWLRSGEVDKKDIIISELCITPIGLKQSSARIFPKNTVLIAMYGATAGQVGILRFEASTNQAVCGILPNKKFIPEFLYYKFSAGKTDLIKQAVGGAQPNISQIKIKNTLVPVLSISEQQSIVSKPDTLSIETIKLEAVYEKKLADLEELKKSLLQKAFNGELTEASA